MGVKPRCFFDTALVELFALQGGSQCVANAILRRRVIQPVKIDARVPDADSEKDARAGTYNKSISFSLHIGPHGVPAFTPSQLLCLQDLVAATAWIAAIRSLLLRHLAQRPIGTHR
jgi:hypothetical protein